MNEFTTPKGTTLPLLDLKGRNYLQVVHRIVWFREECGLNYGIVTHLLEKTPDYALFKAEITNETGRVISSGTQDCYAKEFPDYVAKAETSAIGRALANAGFGTAFAPDLEEGERLSDAPLNRNAPTAAVRTSPQAPSAVVGVASTANKWDVDAAKNFKADPSRLASPAQVGRLLKLCEVHGWDKQKASDLSYNKYGKARFSDLNRAEYDWICDKIQKSNYLDTMRELNDSVKSMLATNPPSAQFDEMNPPLIEEKDIPF